LNKEGFSFNTTSDTEVLCAAYMNYGEECVRHLNGMFAFVIYDHAKNIFFGARDRLGQKPFYYYHKNADFEFASQVSQIEMHHSSLTISNKAILEYLKWGAIPEPLSIYNEVKKLKPGYSFTFELDTGKFQEKKYWDISTSALTPYKGSYEEGVTYLESTLKDAVKLRMYADVPVGVFLSGGVDSSVIAALATRTSNQKVKTFSVKFTEENFDESKYAQMVADHLQTEHHSIVCDPNEGISLIENFNHFYDEPFADPSAVPSMLLAKYTRNHVTVALSGDGGDESFIGYQRYEWTKKMLPIYKLSKQLRLPIGKLLSIIPNDRLRAIANGISKENIEDLYIASLTNIDLSWIDHEWRYDAVQEGVYLFHQEKNLLERMSDFDIKGYLNWHINTKVDRATMSVALEARSPLMDYRIVEFGRNVPTEFKFDGNTQKKILKDVLYKHVPEAYFDRPKAGFTMPFETWFRTDLKDMVLSELDFKSLKEIPGVNASVFQHKIDQHMSGKWNRYPMIWKLLVLKKWLKENSQGKSIVQQYFEWYNARSKLVFLCPV
jgi:asparagine synthase (glutamine-hydrolysing)